jgi:hypothetical protein
MLRWQHAVVELGRPGEGVGRRAIDCHERSGTRAAPLVRTWVAKIAAR